MRNLGARGGYDGCKVLTGVASYAWAARGMNGKVDFRERFMLGWFKVLVCAIGVVLPSCSFAADVVLGISAPAKRTSMKDLDHSPYDQLLKKYVDDRGMVDYRAWKASTSAQKQLDSYIDSLSRSTPAKASKNDQLAFWINAYNAITIKGILREYPTSSIRNHTAKLWGYNIWKNLKLRFAGKELSLDDIEHELLRKMNEPRIHFAIVCASIGCPKLRNEAYVSDKLDSQLSDNAKAFFADREKFKHSGSQFEVSPILKWFAEDFGDGQAELLKTIRPYLPAKAQKAVENGGVRISYLSYDWDLNDQSK